MYPVTERFLKALADEEIQHIRGTFQPVEGLEYSFYDDEIVGTPTYTKQCVEDEGTFMFGELYPGTMEMSLKTNPRISGQLLYAKIRLEFGFKLDGYEEYIPIGTWWVSECTRDAVGITHIKGMDCISKLDVQLYGDSDASYIKRMTDMMRLITEKSGVEFAQTSRQISELAGVSLTDRMGIRTTSGTTCREELKKIAQALGLLAYADRNGRIAFKRYGTETGIVIPAERRFSTKLSDFGYSVQTIAYITKSGSVWRMNTDCGEMRNGINATLMFSGNDYIFDGSDSDYSLFLTDPAKLLALRHTPGETAFYGNPALDLGDFAELAFSDGTTQRILITSDIWCFRAPQTLVSAGAKERTGTSVTSGTSASAYQQIQYNVTKTITTLSAETTQGRSTAYPTEFAGCSFSVSAETVIFVSLNANVTAFSDCTAELRVLLDGIMQTVHSSDSMRGGERKTVSLTFPLTVSGGGHTVTAEAVGDMEIERITCDITGQELKETKTDDTFPTDFKYHVEEGGAVIDYYTVRSLTPRIPACLDGNPVRVLGGQSFTETPVTYVYIPDGTEAIK